MAGSAPIILIAGVAILLVSCGTEGDAAASAAPAPQQGFEQKSGDLFDDDSDKMINRYAKTNPMMQKGGEGPAEEGLNRGNKYFDGEISKREFAAKDYSKKSFWGSKEYARKVYGGPTDGSRLKKGSRFNSQGASENTIVSSESGNRFGTRTHSTGTARENSQAGVTKYSSASTDSSRKSFVQPEIRDWKSQRGLTIDDTKSILGRGN